LSLLKKFFLIINVFVALAMIAGALSIYINPQQFWMIAFPGLLFPYLLLINMFFLFFWIIARFKYAMLPLVAILICLPVIKTYFSFHFSSKPGHSSHILKVMSYNVRNFDLYHWTNEQQTLDKIMNLIQDKKPDVLCFQEFFNADTGKYQTIRRLKTLGFAYYSFEKNVTRKNYGQWGVATFSRYPIINHAAIRIQSSPLNSSLFTDVKVDSIVVRVFNVHLQSIYLSKQDYEYIDQVSNDQDVQVKPTRQIVAKLKRAFLVRAPQAMIVRDEISKSKYPVIVCGDFNDTPASFCYHIIANKLQDAFLTAGWGIAPTYAGLFSAYRIDYILSGPEFSLSDYQTICNQFSDHYAIECAIDLK
jgi:endonuclease/exonuclease/phosphatase family metal-dependent hydrolase